MHGTAPLDIRPEIIASSTIYALILPEIWVYEFAYAIFLLRRTFSALYVACRPPA